jgi:3-(3-hydroxy-phenyl)propionate hydroxylase
VTDSENSGAGPSAFRGVWSLDTGSSAFTFASRGLWGLLPVTGSFERASGQIDVQDSGSVTGSICLDAASITTGIAVRDKHLTSGDFLAAETYPYITYTPASIVFLSDSAILMGNLSIRGNTDQVDVSLTIEKNSDTVVVSFATTVSLTTYGINAPLGMVRSHVDLDVRAQFTRR